MKKSLFYLVAAMALTSCGSDFPNGEELSNQAVLENVKKVFGAEFSPNQDWQLTNSGQVTVKADAANFNPVKVQLLTAYPSFDNDVNILNEAPVSAGQSATLVYDVPEGIDTLFAACVSAEGLYRIQQFVVGDKNVSFASNAQTRSAATRTAGEITIVGEGVVSDNVTAKSQTPTRTYWQNSTWNDKLYTISGHRTAVDDFSSTERSATRTEVYGTMPANVNNISRLEKTGYYYEAHNCLTANGEAPIVVTLVGGQSAMLGWQELYYYYYTPVEGMTNDEEVAYLKTLPKFRICDAAEVLGNGTTEEARRADLRYAANVTKDYENWIKRAYTYTLANFGDKDHLQTVGTTVFPENTRIGFMLRIYKGMTNRRLNGAYPEGVDMYSDPRLNDEVNRYWYSISPATSHISIFTTNNHTYFGTEDAADGDFNDLVFLVEGGFKVKEDKPQVTNYQVYTLAFEDTKMGDYDLNDVVIKAKRLSETSVQYSLEAAGAKDELYLRNINGSKLNGSKEIHAIFGQTERNFINTENGQRIAPVQETVTVNRDFSFINHGYLPYIYNASKRYEIRLSKRGEDPHGIVVPYDFKYPMEHCCVKDAFTGFNLWGMQDIDGTDWFKHPVAGKVYLRSIFQ